MEGWNCIGGLLRGFCVGVAGRGWDGLRFDEVDYFG